MFPSLARSRAPFRNGRTLLAVMLATFAVPCIAANHPVHGGSSAPEKSAVDEANPLVGTAPLDRQVWIGNAPPPGEPLYTGMTTPGASLPESATEAAPVNINADLGFATGVPVAYDYRRPAMVGFTGGGSTYGARGAPMVMPVVGD